MSQFSRLQRGMFRLHGGFQASFTYLKDDPDPPVLLRCNDVHEEEGTFLRPPAGAFSDP